MPTRPVPPSPRVPVQVARAGGSTGTDAEAASLGRHRSPDTGETPVIDRPARHRRAARDGRVPARSIARVEAAGAAATRPRRVPTTTAAGSVPTMPADLAPDEEDAVTELVARPGARGRTQPDGPSTSRTPGLLGLAASSAALVGAVVVAAAPSAVLPVVGRLGASHAALAAVLALAVLGTACAALGVGREREGRPVGVTGVVVGVAAIVACATLFLAAH